MADICTNFYVTTVDLNPKMDIIWSFDYSIVGPLSASAGLTTFLFKKGGNLNNGGEYSSLGYGPYGSKPGITDGVICIALDTHGEFSRKKLMSTGYTTTNVLSQVMTVRNKTTTDNFNLLTNFSLSSFDIQSVTETQIYNRLKFCLTDSGNTLKIYKLDRTTNDFVCIKILNPNLDFDTTDEMLNLGFSYTSPTITGIGKAKLYIKDICVQGTYVKTLSVGESV